MKPDKNICITDCLIKQCAQAIDDLDRTTSRPLTSEDQARAVLEYLKQQQEEDAQ